MLAFLVILCPPLAVLLTSSPSRAAANFGLTLLLYFPGVFHARGIVDRYTANRRYESLMRVLESRESRLRQQAA